MAEEGSLLEMIQKLSVYRRQAAILFVSLPVATLVVGWILKRFSRRTCSVFLTVSLHLTVLPGVCMTLTVAYLLFFARQNLLARYDVVLFFGPILCMGVTLLAVWKLMPFDEIPGFERLSGLMLFTGVAFGVTYVAYRMAFRVLFFGSVWTLLLLFLVAFVLIRVGAKKIFGTRPATR